MRGQPGRPPALSLISHQKIRDIHQESFARLKRQQSDGRDITKYQARCIHQAFPHIGALATSTGTRMYLMKLVRLSPAQERESHDHHRRTHRAFRARERARGLRGAPARRTRGSVTGGPPDHKQGRCPLATVKPATGVAAPVHRTRSRGEAAHHTCRTNQRICPSACTGSTWNHIRDDFDPLTAATSPERPAPSASAPSRPTPSATSWPNPTSSPRRRSSRPRPPQTPDQAQHLRLVTHRISVPACVSAAHNPDPGIFLAPRLRNAGQTAPLTCALPISACFGSNLEAGSRIDRFGFDTKDEEPQNFMSQRLMKRTFRVMFMIDPPSRGRRLPSKWITMPPT